jgi:hypothetical protein
MDTYVPQYTEYACRCEGLDIVSLVRSRSRDKRADKKRRRVGESEERESKRRVGESDNNKMESEVKKECGKKMREEREGREKKRK